MARTPAFDRATVLDRAMAVFWSKGYEAASVQDLVAATGLLRGSLYAAFGDKRGLFEAALAHYAATVSARTFAALNAPEADLDVIEAVFRQLAVVDAAHPAPGCLVTNTAIEQAPHEPLLRDAIAQALGRLEDRLRGVLEREAASGRLRPDVTPEDAAALLVALAQGLRVLTRLGGPASDLRPVVATAFTALRSTPEKGSRP